MITFNRFGTSRTMTYSADWHDANRRYHVWIDENGKPEDIIHSNPLEKGSSDHRALDLTAKRWANVRNEIVVRIAGGALTEADREYQAGLDKMRADDHAKLVTAVRSRLIEIAAIIPHVINRDMFTVTDEQCVELAALLRLDR